MKQMVKVLAHNIKNSVAEGTIVTVSSVLSTACRFGEQKIQHLLGENKCLGLSLDEIHSYIFRISQ